MRKLNILSQLVDWSNKYFKKLYTNGYISYKEMKYVACDYKKRMQFKQIVPVT